MKPWFDPLKTTLRLTVEEDRHLLLDLLRAQTDLPYSLEQIEASLDSVTKHLQEEWLTVYPWGRVVISTGPKASQGLGFLEDVIALGLALDRLSNVIGFEHLIKRLRRPSHERLSVVLEALCAGRYLASGYELELAPRTIRGKRCDFRVNRDGEWINFECKREYPERSDYYVKLSRYSQELMDTVVKRTAGCLKPQQRIDILLRARPDSRTTGLVVDEIARLASGQVFGQWHRLDGVEFGINPREAVLKPEGLPVRIGRMSVGPAPTKLSQENSEIQVFFNPWGAKELRKVREIISDAVNQLPANQKGVIVLEVRDVERVTQVAAVKIGHAKCRSVVAILVTGNGAWVVPNPKHLAVPLEFVSTAVRPV